MSVPGGYTLLRRGAVRAIVRDDAVTALGPWLLGVAWTPPADAVTIASGRGGAYRAALADGRRVVVRPCRRGGLLGRLVRRHYLGLRPRPFRELGAALEAIRRGVRTPAVVAVRVAGFGVYTGAVVTEEIVPATTLAEALAGEASAERRTAAAARAGATVGRLHAAGVAHADLNVMNILLGDARDADAVLDLDKARVGRAPLAARVRRRNLRRLERSWRKTLPPAPDDTALRRAFGDAYARAGGRPCGS